MERRARLAWRWQPNLDRSSELLRLSHRARAGRGQRSTAALVRQDRLGRQRPDPSGDRPGIGARTGPGPHPLPRARCRWRFASGELPHHLQCLGRFALSARGRARSNRGIGERNAHRTWRGRAHHLPARRAGVRQPRATGSRLDRHHRLPRGDDRRRPVFQAARRERHTRGILRRQPGDSGVGGRHQPVRHQHQLHQLHGDPREVLRNELDVPVEQSDYRARPHVRGHLGGATPAAPRARLGVQLPRDALPPGHPRHRQRAVHPHAGGQPHERGAVPAGAGHRCDHGPRLWCGASSSWG